MSRSILVRSLGLLVLGTLPVLAADPDVQTELRALKDSVEQQSKRVDELSVQVGRLTQAIEAHEAQKGDAAKSSGHSGGNGAPAQAETTPPPPVPPPADAQKPGANPATTAKTEPPKAEALPGNKHQVAKGETLTSIAKQYNISVAELLKANKVQDDRKLQIGQTLTIPTPKSSETTPTQKEQP